MNQEVEAIFDHYLKQIFISKPDVARYLLKHERRSLVIENCCEQIRIAEISNIRQNFDISKYHLVISECAKLFAQTALKHAEEQEVSRLERQRRIDEANRIKAIEEEFEADQKEFESTKLISRPGSVAN